MSERLATACFSNMDTTQTYRQSGIVVMSYIVLAALCVMLPWLYLGRFGLVENFRRLLVFYSFIVLVLCVRYVVAWVGTKYVLQQDGVRIIVHESLLRRITQDVHFTKISSLTVVKEGLGSILFGYGDIEIYTLGSTKPVTMFRVSDPHGLTKLIREKVGLPNA